MKNEKIGTLNNFFWYNLVTDSLDNVHETSDLTRMSSQLTYNHAWMLKPINTWSEQNWMWNIDIYRNDLYIFRSLSKKYCLNADD